MITKIETADVQLDEYQIYCEVNKSNIDDFIDIIRKEVGKWDSDGWDVPVTVTIRTLICMPNIKEINK